MKADLSADVLKLGHHGSDTSTPQTLLDAVNPSIAVISVGKDNDYGHPHSKVLGRLAERNIKVFRTDINGTIEAVSDGASITFNTEKE